MAFTDAEKTDLRRFCGYPVAGASSPNTYTGYRYLQSYGLLEYRLLNLSATEEAVARKYLTDLAGLEADIVGTRTNLDTAEASVWKHNPQEQRDREALFVSWRRKLCGFLGLPPGPDLAGAGQVRIVV